MPLRAIARTPPGMHGQHKMSRLQVHAPVTEAIGGDQ